MRLMHARVSRGKRRKIDSLGAGAVACRLLEVAFAGVAPFLGAAPAVVVVVVEGAEVALGIWGTGVAGAVEERTVRGGWGNSASEVGTGTGFVFVGAGETPLAGELVVDGGCTTSLSVGVDDSGAVVTILNDAVTEGDAGADSVVVAGRANCSTEASSSGGLSECTSTGSDITGSGSVAVEPDTFNDGPGCRPVFLISTESAEPEPEPEPEPKPQPSPDDGTVMFVSTEPSIDDAAYVAAVVFVVVLSTDDPMLFCLGGVVASGVGG